jgi:hypothetical protein
VKDFFLRRTSRSARERSLRSLGGTPTTTVTKGGGFDEANVLNQTVLGAETLGEPANVELKAGEISIQRPATSCSKANESSNRRPILATQYSAPKSIISPIGSNTRAIRDDGDGGYRNPGFG